MLLWRCTCYVTEKLAWSVAWSTEISQENCNEGFLLGQKDNSWWQLKAVGHGLHTHLKLFCCLFLNGLPSADRWSPMLSIFPKQPWPHPSQEWKWRFEADIWGVWGGGGGTAIPPSLSCWSPRWYLTSDLHFFTCLKPLFGKAGLQNLGILVQASSYWYTFIFHVWLCMDKDITLLLKVGEVARCFISPYAL